MKQMQKKVLTPEFLKAGKDGNKFSDFKDVINSYVYDKKVTMDVRKEMIFNYLGKCKLMRQRLVTEAFSAVPRIIYKCDFSNWEELLLLIFKVKKKVTIG